jgi:hypothetical protein
MHQLKKTNWFTGTPVVYTLHDNVPSRFVTLGTTDNANQDSVFSFSFRNRHYVGVGMLSCSGKSFRYLKMEQTNDAVTSLETALKVLETN